MRVSLYTLRNNARADVQNACAYVQRLEYRVTPRNCTATASMLLNSFKQFKQSLTTDHVLASFSKVIFNFIALSSHSFLFLLCFIHRYIRFNLFLLTCKWPVWLFADFIK